MRYTVTEVDHDEHGEPQHAIIRVLGFEHTSHSTFCVSHHLAGWCVEYMRVIYFERARPPTPKDLVAEVRVEALRRGMEALLPAEPNLTTAALKQRWKAGGVGEFVREFLITRKQARDLMRSWEHEEYELMPDEEDSIRAYAEADPENVFIYREGGVYSPDGEEDVRAGLGPPWVVRTQGSDHYLARSADASHASPAALQELRAGLDHAVGARQGAHTWPPASDPSGRHARYVRVAPAARARILHAHALAATNKWKYVLHTIIGAGVERRHDAFERALVVLHGGDLDALAQQRAVKVRPTHAVMAQHRRVAAHTLANAAARARGHALLPAPAALRLADASACIGSHLVHDAGTPVAHLARRLLAGRALRKVAKRHELGMRHGGA